MKQFVSKNLPDTKVLEEDEQTINFYEKIHSGRNYEEISLNIW